MNIRLNSLALKGDTALVAPIPGKAPVGSKVAARGVSTAEVSASSLPPQTTTLPPPRSALIRRGGREAFMQMQ